jgi:hypothetical protein
MKSEETSRREPGCAAEVSAILDGTKTGTCGPSWVGAIPAWASAQTEHAWSEV